MMAWETGFTFKNITGFLINGKYFKEDIYISFNKKYNTRIKVLCLLLNIRAFMLDDSLFSKTNGNQFIFITKEYFMKIQNGF